jgi:hypothetical protein
MPVLLRWEGSSQMFALVRRFLQHVLPAVIRPLRIVWNQIVGFLFLVLAVSAVPRTVHSARELDGGPEALFRVFLGGIFITLMAAFGIYSFWRAHKVPKLR